MSALANQSFKHCVFLYIFYFIKLNPKIRLVVMDPSSQQRIGTNSSRPSRNIKKDQSQSDQRKGSPTREVVVSEKPKSSIVEKAVQRLKNGGNKSVTLLLCDSRLTDDDVQYLAKNIKLSTSIRTLSLFDTNLTVTGAKLLSEALSSQDCLTMLDLGHNKIGSQGVEAFCNALIRNSSLRTLGLANTGMGNSGATAMAHVMRINCTLTEVYLNSNQISDEGAKELAGALVFNDRSRLSKLFLFGNEMTDVGIGEFQKLLQDSPEVEERVPLSESMCVALALGMHPRVGEESAILHLAGEQQCPVKGDKKIRRQVCFPTSFSPPLDFFLGLVRAAERVSAA